MIIATLEIRDLREIQEGWNAKLLPVFDRIKVLAPYLPEPARRRRCAPGRTGVGHLAALLGVTLTGAWIKRAKISNLLAQASRKMGI